MKDLVRFGERSTSDVVVRLRTQDARDEWFYCHSAILVEKSKYFADRLSENWPTCQILDSRNCVEVYCDESDFGYHVTVLRLLYIEIDDSLADSWQSARNALCILQVAQALGCPQLIASCLQYVEAVSWDEFEEEEVLRIIPSLGSVAGPILARLQPVDPLVVVQVFLKAFHYAMSSCPPLNHDSKLSVQEQLEYMLTEDDDAPLLTADANVKFMVGECVRKLLDEFNDLLITLSCDPEALLLKEKMQQFQSYLSDILWAWQMVAKLNIVRDFVNYWAEASEKIITVAPVSRTGILLAQLKVLEVSAKVLEAISCGTIILPPAKRFHMLKVWLPYVRAMKPLVVDATSNEEATELKISDEIWQLLESSFVSITLALPSVNQAEILTEWLESEHSPYPDLSEAFEIWCYRSKVAERRLAELQGNYGADKKL